MKMDDKWEDRFYVLSYQMAKDGETDRAVARACGVSLQKFRRWIERRPALAAALDAGRSKEKEAGTTFQEFAYGNLPPDAREVWDRLVEATAVTDEAEGRARLVEAQRLLWNRGKACRQHLFVHALVNCHFVTSEACRLTNIPATTVAEWVKSDVAFATLVRGIEQVKKDFFERALVRKVAEGDSAAIIFANKTLNRDRGYAERISVEKSGTVRHEHSFEEIEDRLTPEAKRVLLEAIRAEGTRPAIGVKVVDGELVEGKK